MGRNTKGVKGITLQEGDEVVGMVVADPGGYLLTVCENGFGKRTPFGANVADEEGALVDGEEVTDEAADESSEVAPEEGVAGEGTGEAAADSAEQMEPGAERSAMRYRKQRRGGKGVRDIRTTERNGLVVGIASVHDDDDIM